MGVPVGLNWGVLVVAVVLALSLARVSLPVAAPNHPSSAYWFAAVVGVLAFLGSLLGHELGHSWVAGRNDVRVVEITLWLFGGVAKLEGDADNPGAEFRIAAAGPAMSALLGAASAGLAVALDAAQGNTVLVGLLWWLALVNAVLAVSNLLPAFPLDGGRMLRATMWRRTGRKRSATRRSSLIGQVLAGALALAGVAVFVWLSKWSGAWTVALALFLFVAARSEWLASVPQPELLSRAVGDLGRRLPAPLPSGATVADLEQLAAAHPGVPLLTVVDPSGRVASVVVPDAVMRIPPAQRRVVPVTALTEPLWSLPRVHPAEPVQAVLERLGRGQHWRALVTDGSDVGSVLCSEDVERVVELASA
jgi:Zn-dependent protease